MSQVLSYQQTRLLLPRALSFAPVSGFGRARLQFFQNDQGALPLAPSVTGRNETVVGDLQCGFRRLEFWHCKFVDFVWLDMTWYILIWHVATKCSHFRRMVNPRWETDAPRCGPHSHSKGEALAATGRPPGHPQVSIIHYVCSISQFQDMESKIGSNQRERHLRPWHVDPLPGWGASQLAMAAISDCAKRLRPKIMKPPGNNIIQYH